MFQWLLASFVSFALAFFCYAIWAVGSHGHTTFRPHMAEVWVIVILILLFISFGVYFLVKALNKVRKR